MSNHISKYILQELIGKLESELKMRSEDISNLSYEYDGDRILNAISKLTEAYKLIESI